MAVNWRGQTHSSLGSLDSLLCTTIRSVKKTVQMNNKRIFVFHVFWEQWASLWLAKLTSHMCHRFHSHPLTQAH